MQNGNDYEMDVQMGMTLAMAMPEMTMGAMTPMMPNMPEMTMGAMMPMMPNMPEMTMGAMAPMMPEMTMGAMASMMPMMPEMTMGTGLPMMPQMEPGMLPMVNLYDMMPQMMTPEMMLPGMVQGAMQGMMPGMMPEMMMPGMMMPGMMPQSMPCMPMMPCMPKMDHHHHHDMPCGCKDDEHDHHHHHEHMCPGMQEPIYVEPEEHPSHHHMDYTDYVDRLNEMYPDLPSAAKEVLRRLMEIDFTLIEFNLYLDTHPTDARALAQFNRFTAMREPLVRRLQEIYGPLTPTEPSRYPWAWLNQPWPWRIEF